VLTHSWQERQWIERQAYEPCADPSCSCHCEQAATQEDMLCDTCRERNGISALDERRIVAFLAGTGAVAEVPG
jgi:hypothetical protein